MGRREKSYSKNMYQQVRDKLVGMQAFSESKKEDKIQDKEFGTDIVSQKIYSFSTYQTYKKHCNYFVSYVRTHYPEVTTIKKAKKYVNEFLQLRVDQGLSAWTIKTEQAALNKLFDIKKDDPNRFQAPVRQREDITRSRDSVEMDKHFSVKSNIELINFCKGTGLRRQGVKNVKGKDLITRKDIEAEIDRIQRIPETERTSEDKIKLNICLQTRFFTKNHEYFVHIREKGGKERISPIIGSNIEAIVERFKNTPAEKKVWNYVNKNADIHGYRAEYITNIYKMYARDIEKIPYNALNKGSGLAYQKDVYICRKDEAGKKLDKIAMRVASIAAGHNRIDVIAAHYIRNI